MDQCLEHDVFHAYKLIVPTPVIGVVRTDENLSGGGITAQR